MKVFNDDYLNGVSSAEVENISRELKKVKCARLEISIRHPYGHVERLKIAYLDFKTCFQLHWP